MGKGKKTMQQQSTGAWGGSLPDKAAGFEQTRGNAAAVEALGEMVVDAVEEIVPDVRPADETPPWADELVEAPESSYDKATGVCSVGDTTKSQGEVLEGKRYTNEADGNEIRLRVDFARKVEELLLGKGNASSTDGTLGEDAICALMAWQDERGLTPDGRLTPETREWLEKLMGANETRRLGDHLDRRILMYGVDNEPYRHDVSRRIIEDAGGYFDDTPGKVNILGIRGVEYENGYLTQTDSARKEADGVEGHRHFHGAELDDVLISIWVDESGKKRAKIRRGSLDPNMALTDHGGKDGTAHVRDGQYVYELGKHRTKDHPKAMAAYLADETVAHEVLQKRIDLLDPTYEFEDNGDLKAVRYKALNPVSLEIIREHPSNDNNDMDAEEYDDSLKEIRERNDRYTDPSGIATNIHSSPKGEVSSLGCPNIPLDEGYLEFIEEIEENGGKDARVLFTIVDASKIKPESVEQIPMFDGVAQIPNVDGTSD